MAEKIYPSINQSTTNNHAGVNTVTDHNNNLTFPSTKPLLHNSARQTYLPPPRRRSTRRSCCCSCCLWITFILLLLIIIAAAAGGVVYLLYRPHRPTFAVTSLQISQFNLTSSNQLNTSFNFTATSHNPNSKIAFNFDPVSVTINSNGVNVGDGVIPAFDLPKKNTTKLRTIVSKTGEIVGDDSELKSDLKNKKSVPITIRLDTKVKVKIGSLKMKKVPVRVVCKGIKITVPTGKSTSTASTSDVKCKLDLRIKIWKWRI